MLKFIANFRFCALFLTGCFALLLGMTRGAFALSCIDVARPYTYSCDAGQFLECGIDPYDGNCSDCVCCFCEAGYTSTGGGHIDYCDAVNPGIPSGDSGCRPIGDLCSGYDTPCPSYFSDIYRCKELNVGCPSGCHTYDMCKTTTGEISQYTDGNCHMEGNTCYANTRACSEFTFSGGFCGQDFQQGNAVWTNSNKWNVQGCTCVMENLDIEHFIFNIYIGCKSLYAYNHVADADKFIADTNSQIKYTVTRAYCARCYPGHIPDIVSSPDENGIIRRPENEPGRSWGTSSCNAVVPAGYYADGCIINWAASNGEAVVNECKQQCPLGMVINGAGATGPDWCEVDSSQHFTDNTGRFTIGAGQCSP